MLKLLEFVHMFLYLFLVIIGNNKPAIFYELHFKHLIMMFRPDFQKFAVICAIPAAVFAPIYSDFLKDLAVFLVHNRNFELDFF